MNFRVKRLITTGIASCLLIPLTTVSPSSGQQPSRPAASAAAESAQAGGHGGRRRYRGGRGAGPRTDSGRASRAGHGSDRDTIHFLLGNHAKIARKVNRLANGVETVTESKDPNVAGRIKEHVKAMKRRVEQPSPIRMRDPLFAEIFRHADKIEMKIIETKRGVRVIETSRDPYVVRLIQSHAEVVSKFAGRGFEEARKTHPVPRR